MRQSPSLIRASRFCRPPRRQGQGQTQTALVDVSSIPTDDVLLPVQLFVCLNDETNDNRSLSLYNDRIGESKEPSPSGNNNISQVAFGPWKVLRALSLLSGSLVTLRIQAEDQQQSVTVVLKHCNNRNLEIVHKQSTEGEETDPVVFINVLTATNLGLNLADYHNTAPDIKRVNGYLSTANVSYTDEEFPLAESVILRLLGRPLHPPALSPVVATLSSKTASRSDKLPNHWPLPPAGTLLERNKLIVSYYREEQPQVYFYQILHVDSSSEPESTNDSARTTVWRATTSTVYRLDCGVVAPTCCSQLPPLSVTRKLVVSSKEKPYVRLPPQPDVNTLVRVLSSSLSSSSSQSSTTLLPVECIRHLIGTDQEHGLVVAVKTAADHLGRQCIVVSGLASYAYWSGGQVATTSSNPSGGLVDKLLGLEAALNEASRHAPSVLLIQDIDTELSVHDQPLRQDEENRIWSLLSDQLSPKRHGVRDHPDETPPLRQVAPVLVLLSSAKPLAPGPLLQKMAFPSIPCSVPDAKYIQYLWSSGDNGDYRPMSDIPLTYVIENLKGRNVGEILQIREQFCLATAACPQQPNNSNAIEKDSETARAALLLEELCRQCDEQRRQKSGLGRIPSVSWQDVGGLAHVRQEILDAIELPLQHPHLFPARTRSGVLLYGPPGTGKTLIAKAVATECGLPFLSIKGPELLGSYVGESEAQVRQVFAQARDFARQNQPAACILFFDELDSLAPRRGEQASGGNVMDRVVATFFGELDKESADCSVFVLGATNRPDLLDPSLLRPGRFDRLVYLGINPTDRARILTAQIRNLCLDGDPQVLAEEVVQHLPENVTGADLSTVASGAQLRATERLCVEADQELESLRPRQVPGKEKITTIDQLLETWNENRLKPVVKLRDLLQAAESVVPSVSVDELQHYDSLRDEFRR